MLTFSPAKFMTHPLPCLTFRINSSCYMSTEPNSSPACNTPSLKRQGATEPTSGGSVVFAVLRGTSGRAERTFRHSQCRQSSQHMNGLYWERVRHLSMSSRLYVNVILICEPYDIISMCFFSWFPATCCDIWANRRCRTRKTLQRRARPFWACEYVNELLTFC